MSRFCPNPECPGLARDGVVGEFVDHVLQCLDCGTRTIPGDARLSNPADSPEVEYHDLTTVFLAADLAQGHVVAGTIEAAGIPVFIRGEFLQGAVGELPTNVAQVEIQVPVDRVDRAREIARRWERPLSERRGRRAVRDDSRGLGRDLTEVEEVVEAVIEEEDGT